MTAVPSARAPMRAALLLTSALGLSACASVPDLGPAPLPKVPASHQASPADWPADAWWRRYGDAQLDRVVERALADAPDMAIAQARLRRAEAMAVQAGAMRLPYGKAGASASQTRQSKSAGGRPDLGWQEAGELTLTLGYDLDLWGRNRAALVAATSEAEAARADAAMARLVLSTSVAAAYGDLRRLFAEQDAAREAASLRTQTLTLMEARAGEGLETEAAVGLARAAAAAADGELAAVDETIALTRNLLSALAGQDPAFGHGLERPAAPRLEEALSADLGIAQLGHRPDVAASRLRVEAAASRIKVARADFYPNVRLSALLGLQAIGFDRLLRGDSAFGSVGPAISLPLFPRGRLDGAYRGARAEYDAAVAAYDQTLISALHEVADVEASRAALTRRLDRARQALAASEATVRLIRDRYRGGLASYLEVIVAEDGLVGRRRAAAQLESRAFALDVALVRALGGDSHPSPTGVSS